MDRQTDGQKSEATMTVIDIDLPCVQKFPCLPIPHLKQWPLRLSQDELEHSVGQVSRQSGPWNPSSQASHVPTITINHLTLSHIPTLFIDSAVDNLFLS